MPGSTLCTVKNVIFPKMLRAYILYKVYKTESKHSEHLIKKYNAHHE